jgi:hypothetical protein
VIAPLPCPFCGHEADASRVGHTRRFAVTCGADEGCIVEAQATAGTLEDAVKLWNTRAVGVTSLKVAA